jgi:Transcriptional regulators of sugar metabolism
MEDRSAFRTRRDDLLRTVREHGTIGVTELAEALGTPLATVRRDLRILEGKSLIRRSYGEVHAVESSRYETTLAWRTANESVFRQRVAETAATMLDGAATIYIDEGHTTALVAAHLPTDRPLTIITPSIVVAADLASSTTHEVLMLGGRVRARTMGTVDYWVRDMLSGFVIDLAFLGANGVTAEHGLTTPDPAVATIKAAAVRASRRRIFVGDHTKFGISSFARFAGIPDFECFVTTDRVPAGEARRLSRMGANLVYA